MSQWIVSRQGQQWRICWNNTLVAIAHCHPHAQELMEELEPGVFRWTRTLDQPAQHQEMDVTTCFPCQYAMIPAVSYNGNGWGSDRDYVGFSYQGEPYKLSWHRASVPGATYSGGDGFSVSMFCEEDGGCSLSLLEEGPGRRHRLSWPEEESPRYLAGGHGGQIWGGPITVQRPPRSKFIAYLVLDHDVAPRTGWRKLLDTAWRMHVHPVPCWYDAQTIRQMEIAYTKSLYTREADREAFSIGFTWRDGQWVKRDVIQYEIGWCGQNASLANSLLAYFQETGDTEARDMAIGVLDSWVKHNRLENGLFRVMLDDLPQDKLDKEIQDACNLGTASVQFWEAYDRAKACGLDRPAYAQIAQGIADFACRIQREDGCLGKGWYRDGSLAVAEGTVGAFLIPALLETYRRIPDAKYKNAALAAHAYYMKELEENGYTTAGALDTYCIDKESSMPLLRSSLDLYALTQDPDYLRYAEDAAWYLSTWQWHYSTPYPEGSALRAMHYDTFGGTAVSTAHLHIDPYALHYIPEMLQLAEYTGHLIWKERAAAIWQNATQGISDGNLEVMGKKRPLGSQDEGFMHTRFGDTFQVSQWLVAWPCAFRLEVLRKLGAQISDLESDLKRDT